MGWWKSHFAMEGVAITKQPEGAANISRHQQQTSADNLKVKQHRPEYRPGTFSQSKLLALTLKRAPVKNARITHPQND